MFHVAIDLVLGAAVAAPLLAAAAAGHLAHSRGSKVQELEIDHRRIFALTGEMLFELSLDGKVRRAADAVANELGLEPETMIGETLADRVHPDDRGILLATLNPLERVEGIRTFDARIQSARGDWRALHWRAEIDRAAEAIHVTARPPSEPGERQHQLGAFDLAFAAAPIGMAVVGVDGAVRRVNHRLCELLGHTEREVVGTQLDSHVHAEDLASQREQIARLVARELAAVSLELRVRHADGHEVPSVFAVSLVRDDAGTPLEYVVQIQDTSERQALRERVRYEAEHDALTGLLNRRTFAAMLTHHVASARRYHREGALVVIDIDRLADVNEAHGTHIGDQVLEMVARTLSERLRETDLIARLDGDEFGVILAELDETAARRITTEIVRTISETPVEIIGSPSVAVRVSAGLALFSDEPQTAEQLFADADVALAEAKEDPGGPRSQVFDRGSAVRRRERNSRRTWAEKLRHGLERDAFLLDAQPIIELATGLPVQYELLLRMRDDDGGIIRPNAFMHVAERYGLMRAIDEWVVRRAIALGRARIEHGRPVTLAVNLSGESVTDPAFLPLVVAELIDHPEVGEHLVFEITERTAVDDLEQAKRLIARLGEFGCRFALDDFGAGASSLSYLKNLPVDYVKLDGAFTRGLPHDAADREIVGAVVQVARGLGRQIVAECVEDQEILDAIRSFGIELAQGLHVGRPERASELLAIDGVVMDPASA